MQKAEDLLAAKRYDEALAEAKEAVALSPTSVKATVVLGDVLAAMGNKDEARQSYQQALTLSQTVAPEYQVGWVEGLQKKLAAQ